MSGTAFLASILAGSVVVPILFYGLALRAGVWAVVYGILGLLMLPLAALLTVLVEQIAWGWWFAMGVLVLLAFMHEAWLEVDKRHPGVYWASHRNKDNNRR